MSESVAPRAVIGDVASVSADGADAWIQGFHGVLVGFDGIPPVALRQLALSRRSTGLGPMDALVALPSSAVQRAVPRRSSGARSAYADALPSRQEGAPPPSVSGASIPVQPAEATGGARSAGLTSSFIPAPRAPSEQLETITLLLERRLPDARYLLLPNRSRTYAVTKRLVDVVGATLLLLLAAPVMAVLGLLIRLDSPGPALFTQERVTRGGQTFRFCKFRTMFVDARDRFPELYDYGLTEEQFESAFYKLADDPRNTRVGKWLRRTTLDELPNLFNVLKGDISLVGPRPDLPEFVRLYRPEELCLLFTKAGLTGVAQVAGRSLLTVRERLTLDMRYVAHQTLLLDLRILWRTVIVVLSARGAF